MPAEQLGEIGKVPILVAPPNAPYPAENIDDINTLTKGILSFRSWADRAAHIPSSEERPELVKGMLLRKLLSNIGDVYRERNGLTTTARFSSLGRSVETLQAFDDLFSPEQAEPEVDGHGDIIAHIGHQLREAALYMSDEFGGIPLQTEELQAPYAPEALHSTLRKLTGLNHDIGNELAILSLGLFHGNSFNFHASTLRKLELLSSRAPDIVRGIERPLVRKIGELRSYIRGSMYAPEEFPSGKPFALIGEATQWLKEQQVEYSFGFFDSLYDDIADDIRNEFLEVTANPGVDPSELAPFAEVSFSTSEDRKYAYTVFRNKGEGFPEEILEHGFQYGLSIRPEGKKSEGIALAFHTELLREHGGDLIPENTPSGAQLTVVQKIL